MCAGTNLLATCSLQGVLCVEHWYCATDASTRCPYLCKKHGSFWWLCMSCCCAWPSALNVLHSREVSGHRATDKLGCALWFGLNRQSVSPALSDPSLGPSSNFTCMLSLFIAVYWLHGSCRTILEPGFLPAAIAMHPITAKAHSPDYMYIRVCSVTSRQPSCTQHQLNPSQSNTRRLEQ